MALVWPWCGLGVALVWLWVALGGLSPLFLLSAFCFLLLPESGFGWLCRAFLPFAFWSSVAVLRRVDCLLPFPKRAAGTTKDPKCPKSRTSCLTEAPTEPASSVPLASGSFFVSSH